MVVLSVGMESMADAHPLAKGAGIELDERGFCLTKGFYPVATTRPGVFACGAFTEPKDIPDSVTQSSGAAAAALSVIGEARGTLTREKDYPPEIDVSKQEPRVGAFICSCGSNIAGVVDVDWYREAERTKTVLSVDKEKAALNGISEEQVARAVQTAIHGADIDLFHQPADKERIDIILQLPRAQRARVAGVLNIALRSEQNPQAPLVPLRELVMVSEEPVDQPIYHKNLKPVIYVTGDVAGAVESPVYAIFAMNDKLAKLDGREFGGSEQKIAIFNIKQPFTEAQPSMKWDGEWHITLEVFRDLGLAFCAVMVLIYMLMVGWFKDYITPLVVMAAIPFSLIGILPAHWALGAFFTATSMIGFMAGAGIVVRNSIILVDFIELRVSHGLPLAEAVVEAGAIRFRPMLLTALAVVVGASVILADPIFQGLAISLMFGEIASLLISRMAVPVLYYMIKKRGGEKTRGALITT